MPSVLLSCTRRSDGHQKTCACACDSTHQGAKCAVAINNTPAHETAEELFAAAYEHHAAQRNAEALPLFRRAADSFGHSGLPASEKNALDCYIRAARQGEANAQNVAALFLNQTGREDARGGGIVPDGEQALVWMQLAADGGHTRAKEQLANYKERCTGACRRKAMAIVSNFTAQDACEASLFSRANHCGGHGEPTPAQVP